MNATLSSWFVILLAASGANLPFLSERVFALIPVRFGANSGIKPFWLRLLELAVLYALVGAAGYLLESRIGNVFAQGWEFFAITACFFIVLAYPGFAFRYLRKRHG